MSMIRFHIYLTDQGDALRLFLDVTKLSSNPLPNLHLLLLDLLFFHPNMKRRSELTDFS